ncbi:hypothetical protein DID88_010213 [Monilinia fructigena]|uniref:Mediator of RNA polymerase II transcription subunit 19 n=1 Tax=Monilinia fructigena TaxID=38457 RepID=A0A395IMU7_9HELO|nr:hypothetical protein DID88_010213 [Monilinia fructigena]
MSNINSAIEASQLEDSSNKRKRDIEDLGGRDQKKVQVEDSRPSINDLHQDVGKKYLLCRTLHKPQSMSIQQNLFDRIHKSLGIAGQFDAVKGDPQNPGSLYSLVNPALVPTREIWEETHVKGREIEKGIPDDLRPNLSKAAIMARGSIPKGRFNLSVIGEMGNQVAHDPLKNRSAADIPRPRRTSVKKRSYGDASYEGYGEGYIDDDAEYSAGDGDDRSGGRKRPKKVGSVLYPSNVQANKGKTPSSHGFQGPMRQSYGPGMVGA